MKKTTKLHQRKKKIFNDWDFEKNLIPIEKATLKSKVWWKCNNNHSYEVSVNSRIRSSGCKYCDKTEKLTAIRRKKASKKEHIFKIRPDLKEEWDYLVNDEIDPNILTIGSNIIVGWKCKSCDYKWSSTIKARKKSKCPVCTKKEIARKKQKLAVEKRGISLFYEFPDLMKEWDFENNIINPKEITSGSSVTVNWVCKFNHKWPARVYNRTLKESGCPDCKASTSKLEVFFLSELRLLYKNVSWRKKYYGYECDIYIEDINVGVEIDGGYWHKDKIQSDTEKSTIFKSNNIDLYRVREEGLPKIDGKIIPFSTKEKKIDIFLNFIKVLGKEYLNPRLKDYILDGKQKGGKEYKKILSHLPAPAEGETLSYMHPEIAKEWDFKKNSPLLPDMFSFSANSKVSWICSDCKHQWKATINNRTRNDKPSGCPECYKKVSGENLRKSLLETRGKSFADEYPEMINYWDYKLNDKLPSDFSSGSNYLANFICENGHNYEKTIFSVTDSLNNSKLKTPCPECYENLRGTNLTTIKIEKDGSLLKNYPDLCKEWSYDKNELAPSEYHSGSDKKVYWKCENNHLYQARINSRVSGLGKCQECKSISHLHPELMKEWDFSKNKEFDPKSLNPGSKKVVWWKCKKNHSVQSSIVAKTKSGICQECKSISHLHPELMKEWDFSKNKEFDPKSLNPGSKKVVWWKCRENGHGEYEQIIASRVSGKRGCKICIKNNYFKV